MGPSLGALVGVACEAGVALALGEGVWGIFAAYLYKNKKFLQFTVSSIESSGELGCVTGTNN